MCVRFHLQVIDTFLYLSVEFVDFQFGSLRLHARGCMTEYYEFCKPVQKSALLNSSKFGQSHAKRVHQRKS
jgi:hypothetical protein